MILLMSSCCCWSFCFFLFLVYFVEVFVLLEFDFVAVAAAVRVDVVVLLLLLPLRCCCFSCFSSCSCCRCSCCCHCCWCCSCCCTRCCPRRSFCSRWRAFVTGLLVVVGVAVDAAVALLILSLVLCYSMLALPLLTLFSFLRLWLRGDKGGMEPGTCLVGERHRRGKWGEGGGSMWIFTRLPESPYPIVEKKTC